MNSDVKMCQYRQKVRIPEDLKFEVHTQLGQFKIGDYTGYCCTHPNGPYVMFMGRKDPYLCKAAVECGLCPLKYTR